MKDIELFILAAENHSSTRFDEVHSVGILIDRYDIVTVLKNNLFKLALYLGKLFFALFIRLDAEKIPNKLLTDPFRHKTKTLPLQDQTIMHYLL